MENEIYTNACIENAISLIIEHVDNNECDKVVVNTLISILTTAKEMNVKFSDMFNEKLIIFISHCFKRISNFFELPQEFSAVLNLMTLLLDFQPKDSKYSIIQSVLPDLVAEVNSLLDSIATNRNNNCAKLVKYINCIEVLLESFAENEINNKTYCVVSFNLNNTIIRSLSVREKLVITYALSLFTVYYKITKCSMLIQQIWTDVMQRLLQDNSYFECYLTIVTYFIQSSIDKSELIDILKRNEFWMILEKCLESNSDAQKHALYILKFGVSCLRDFNDCDNLPVWNHRYPDEYKIWWKTYFIIIESLNEKQTHLILPQFSSLCNLINSKVRVDVSWILLLIQRGLGHDSRTVRLHAVFCLLDIKNEVFVEKHIHFVVSIFINAVNDSTLFKKMSKTSDFDNFKNKFIKWIANFRALKHCSNFCKHFFYAIAETKWSPVPLFYVLKFIAECEDMKYLDSEFLKTSKNAVSSITRFHNVLIRAGIQHLYIKFVIKFAKCNEETLTHFLDFLMDFNESECLLRNVSSWHDIVRFIRCCIDSEYSEKILLGMIKNNIECDRVSIHRTVRCVSQTFILFDDSFLLTKNSVSVVNHLTKIVCSFETCLQQPYFNRKIQNNYLKFIVSLCNIINNQERIKSECSISTTDNSTFITSLIAKKSKHIISYIIRMMMCHEDNFELLNIYECCLNEFHSCISSFIEDIDASYLLSNWLTKSCTHLRNKYCALQIILWICKTVSKNNIFNKLIFENTIASAVVDFIKSNEQKSLILKSVSDVRISGKMQSDYLNAFWSVFKNVLCFKNENIIERIQVPLIFNLILESFSFARNENFSHIFEALRYLFSNNNVLLNYEQLVFKVMDESWSKLEETQATSFYLLTVTSWVRIFFQRNFLKSVIYQSKISTYVDKLLDKIAEDGNSYQNIILILREIPEIEEIYDIYPKLTNVLINIFCVTHIDRKDQKIENETINCIRSSPDIAVNQIKKFDYINSSEEMRLIALHVMLRMDEKNDEIIIAHCSEIIKMLTLEESTNKKRYFNDSLYHRIKHKKLQLLLIFETIYFDSCTKNHRKEMCNEMINDLYHYVVDSIFVEPHQPSVRYMFEWLLIRLIIHYRSILENKFWGSFSEASDERIGSICSFISVAFHLANVFRKETFIEQAVQFVLPWTMAQHFNARLYAQAVFTKIINMNNKIADKYSVILNSVECNLKKGNAVKNSIKLQQDFYYCCFHPMDHFSLQTIFWELPRLSNICREEWIGVDLYERYLGSEKRISIPYINDRINSLSHFDAAASWIVKGNLASVDEKQIESFSINVHETQKKFIPPTNDFASMSEPPKPCGNLIVVASLLDRAPNLGGLTRTCEIFAVSLLVLNNLEIIRNKEFISLSITAEKHVPMIEVKKYNLFYYLKKMKEQEFCIVGAEQVTNSKNLGDFKFPLNSVLVLGNEKEGIPANLLPLLDVCVEIPQIGVIRSLNVHVSASLFIWEYAKQHQFDKNSLKCS